MESKSSNKSTVIIVVVCVLIVVLWWLIPRFISPLFCVQTIDKYDPFSVFNSLFSGLAFAVVIVTLFVQRAEFKKQIDQAKQTNINSLMVPLLMEYRSSQMHDAISSVWGFKRDHGERYLDEYEKIYKTNDIHYKRRLVSHFYGILAGLFETESIPGEIIYSYWSKSDLDIIPKIILPIENRLHEILTKEEKPGPFKKDPVFLKWEGKLQRLYENAP